MNLSRSLALALGAAMFAGGTGFLIGQKHIVPVNCNVNTLYSIATEKCRARGGVLLEKNHELVCSLHCDSADLPADEP